MKPVYRVLFPGMQGMRLVTSPLGARVLFCHLLAISFVLMVSAARTAQALEQTLPSPLNLTTALDYAAGHPAVSSDAEPVSDSFTRAPLFLACHNQAFTNVQAVDPQRNHHASQLVSPTVRQQLIILQAYLDVRLADLSHTYINEKMAGAYIDYDRAKTRQELKQVSELDVARLHAEYQFVRQQFHASEATQRLTRSILAQSMNRPLQLPADINPPPKINYPSQLPEQETLIRDALENNDWFIRQSKAASDSQSALLSMALRQEILELLLRLRVLRTASEQAKIEGFSRDLNLELSRTLYEMEVKADLGDSMTFQSLARRDSETFNYCQLLAWAQLNALRGRPLLTPPDKPKPTDAPQ